MLTGFSPRIVQGAVNAFAGSHPNVRLSIVTGAHEEIFQQIIGGQLDLVINDQRRALSDQFVNAELGDQALYALARQEAVPGGAPLELEALRESMCILVTAPEQRAAETGFWRDVVGLRSDILFASGTDEARMNVAAGAGWLPCDRDAEVGEGLALAPLTRGGAPLVRKMFAFWLESNDSSLQREFAEILRQHFG